MIRELSQQGVMPPARFGHTTTLVNEHTVVLFGGATGDSGRYIITGDTYALDTRTNHWRKVEVENLTPPPRAAHAACTVDMNQLVIYGGATGGGTLSPDDLMLMDYREQGNSAWLSVPVTGKTPGRRYGHSMVYHKPMIIVYGGNTGSKCTDDIFFLDVDSTPFSWQAVTLSPDTPRPSPRVYHSAEVCREGPASGMMVVFGGRTNDSTHLKDIWGLRQHRDGRWDWVEAPTKKGTPPLARCQHSATFDGPRLIISGGRNEDVSQSLPTNVYSTMTCEWVPIAGVNRFRHSTWAIGGKLYTYGGFDHNNAAAPTDTLQSINVEEAVDMVKAQRRNNNANNSNNNNSNNNAANDNTATAPTQQQPQATPPPVAAAVAQSQQQQQPDVDMPINDTPIRPSAVSRMPNGPPTPPPSAVPAAIQPGQVPSSLPNQQSFNSRRHTPIVGVVGEVPPHEPSIKIASQIIVSTSGNQPSRLSSFVQKINIDSLELEKKRILSQPSPGMMTLGGAAAATSSLAVPTVHLEDDIFGHAQSGNNPGLELASKFIRTLLKPGNHNGTDPWTLNGGGSDGAFALQWVEVAQLCDETLAVMKKQPSLMRLRAPIKVYGDTHGQYADLMRMFGEYGGPWDGPGGDIDTTEYLFLGDYVDRGSYSLETICLLFALKLKYPGQVHLIRGNHEDANINSVYGFMAECQRRLREDCKRSNSCWARFNQVFEYMPLGATIDDKILCIHGGIGGTITKLEDIASIPRPLKVEQVPNNEDEQKITDLLWSDPTDDDSYEGVLVNETRDPDGTGRIYKFGPDRVRAFLQANNLDLIIRAHECVMDGFERFAGGSLITLFSATDYCGSHRNAGALLFIRRDLTVQPKIIYPTERELPQWDATNIEARPPTPPRVMVSNKYHKRNYIDINQ